MPDPSAPIEPTSVFDITTAVTPAGEGRWRAELDAGWVVGGGVNGGYLLATVGRAVQAALGGADGRWPDPLAVSAHYLSAAVPGPAEVAVRVLRTGGTVATVAADLQQDGGTRLTVLATYGSLATGTGEGADDDVRTTATPWELPPYEACVPNTLAPPELRRVAPLMERFDLRFHPDQVGWAVGEPDHSGVLSGWFALEDGREPDPLSLLLVVDALPPVTFTFGTLGWAPTLELTAHVRARPAPGLLRVGHRTRNVAGGLFEEDCEVWDAAGRLVAQGRQLARLPRPVG